MDQTEHNLNEETPQFLKELKSKDAGYRLPNNYFDKMQSSILDQVVEKKTAQNIKLLDNFKNWFQLLLKPQYALVAIAAMILIGVFIGTGDDPTGVNSSFSSLDDEDLEYFMENEIGDINHQELIATLSVDEINFSIPISSNDAINTIPDDYIEDLDNTTLIDFELED